MPLFLFKSCPILLLAEIFHWILLFVKAKPLYGKPPWLDLDRTTKLQLEKKIYLCLVSGWIKEALDGFRDQRETRKENRKEIQPLAKSRVGAHTSKAELDLFFQATIDGIGMK